MEYGKVEPQEFRMKSNIFISYSRREVGFIDALTSELEHHDFDIWLDYRDLIPGTPWKEQINKGVDESDVILVVVSKESMASKYVELEWRRVIREKKRIIVGDLRSGRSPSRVRKI